MSFPMDYNGDAIWCTCVFNSGGDVGLLDVGEILSIK